MQCEGTTKHKGYLVQCSAAATFVGGKYQGAYFISKQSGDAWRVVFSRTTDSEHGSIDDATKAAQVDAYAWVDANAGKPWA